MKRTKFLRHLRKHGCAELREGSSHSIWMNVRTRETEAIPRHTEVSARLIRKICRSLDVPPPQEK